MIILGVHSSYTGLTHDSSACLVINGRVVAAAEEEKFIRVKSASTFFPVNAIKACLKIAKIDIRQVQCIATDGVTYPQIKDKIIKSLQHYFKYSPRVEIFNHAQAHCAGAFFSSGFEKSLSISVDGSGDKISSSVEFYSKKKRSINYKKLYRSDYKNSLGSFYTVFTNFLGFKSIEGEYKLMGMAAYGKPVYDLSKIIYFNKKTGKIVTSKAYQKLFDTKNYTSINEPSYSENFISKRFKVKRPINTKKFTKKHYNLASSVQFQFTKTYLDLINYFIKKTNSEYLCLAGGCALNCLANKELLKKNLKGIYVMPAASDRGLSLGSAMICASKFQEPIKPVKTMLLGMSYNSKFIEKSLKKFGIRFKKLKNQFKDCAEDIKKGKIVGWFQGRSEFGPRALGSRSILANPNIKGMKNLLNSKIKFRESFRPFAPSILENSFKKYYGKTTADLTSMTFTVDIPKKLKKFLPEAVHFDNTSRVHLVNKSNISFFKLLTEIEKKNNFGAVINTSFNLSGEPNVETPSDAIRTFFSSGIDILYIENYKIEKFNEK
jgi:carbamoyltransferase